MTTTPTNTADTVVHNDGTNNDNDDGEEKDDENEEQQVVVIEEDWSEWIHNSNSNHNNTDSTANDNTIPLHNGGEGLSAGSFSKHDQIRTFQISIQNSTNDDDDDDLEGKDNTKSTTTMTPTTTTTTTTDNNITISIQCVESLSPLDMMDLYRGIHDATGHCVWVGAELFLQAIEFLIQREYLPSSSSQPKQQQCHILELGTGSGVSGIAIAKICQPTQLILTDFSDSALRLCRNNCHRNNIPLNSNDKQANSKHNNNSDNQDDYCGIVSVQKLRWGDHLVAKLSYNHDTNTTTTTTTTATTTTDTSPTSIMLFDTVVATDVLYDFHMWIPILRTSWKSLHQKGILIVSHIPRAAIPEDHHDDNENENNDKDTMKDMTKDTTGRNNRTLESLLIEQAQQVGFTLLDDLKPSDLNIKDTKLCERMEDAGASIFVFGKSRCTQS